MNIIFGLDEYDYFVANEVESLCNVQSLKKVL